MLGYIISDKKTINVDEHEIFSFDILNKTNLNIFVVENNKALYHKLGNNLKCHKNFINVASMYGHVKVLEWFKNSGYKFKYDDNAILWASFNDHVDVIK